MPLRHKDVNPCIVIDIEEPRSPSDRHECGFSDAGTPCNINEPSLTLVPEQKIRLLGKYRDENIQQTVVVEVAEIDPHRPQLLAVRAERGSRKKPRFFERAIVPVVIKEIRAGVICYIKIWPPVVVVVRPDSLHAEAMVRIIYSSFL